MNEKSCCSCGAGPRMVFACSGAADVGAVADLAARRIQKERRAFMCCTAAVAADIKEIVAKARQAQRVVAIDGCGEECARKILERAGFAGFPMIRLAELGMEKGRTHPTEEAVETVVARARPFLPLPGEAPADGCA